MKYIIQLSIVFFSLTISGYAYSQANIRGNVLDQAGLPVPYVIVAIDSLKIGTMSDSAGVFILKDVPYGQHTVSASSLGFTKQVKHITVKSSAPLQLYFELKEDHTEEDEIVIQGKTEAAAIKESGFNVNVIETEKYANVNKDINQILNQSSGIRIRESGGLGSDFTFSLNGYSGNHIRFFVDGLPATISFNNFPVNLIERIEVYKGVVPISLGADALGGAVNIITRSNIKNFVDASYSYGSFNTHRAAVSSRNRFGKHAVLNTDFFLNHSDNDYTIQAQMLDKNTNKLLDPQSVKRFNNEFTSAGLTVEGGLIGTKWADRLLVGVTVSGTDKHLQQGYSMARPIGQAFQSVKLMNGTLKYDKTHLFVKNLNAKVSALYSISQDKFVDTVSRIYEWDGSYVIDPFGYGEYGRYKTVLTNHNNSVFNTATFQYILGRNHSFQLNNTFSLYARNFTDPLAPEFTSLAKPTVFTKNTTGLSYTLSLFENRWSTILFVKKFDMGLRGDYVDNGKLVEGAQTKVTNYGQGIATAFFLTKTVQLKASYEYTSRMPENEEVLGNPPFIQPNRSLVPEQSHNANIGAIYKKQVGKHFFNPELGLIYRNPENFIRMAGGVNSPFAQYQNITAITQIMGIESELRYSYNKRIYIDINATWQDFRYKNKIYRGYADPLYNNRLPNIPYFFGNASIAWFTKQTINRKYRAGLSWTSSFVEWFYLRWESQGQKDLKYIIPRQLSHDITLSLSFQEGKYNISLSCMNITNAELYDNFRIQKPGRSFNIKIRSYLERTRK